VILRGGTIGRDVRAIRKVGSELLLYDGEEGDLGIFAFRMGI
jgi:hypothetical protein